jgi:PHD/YefM family antitoxin component YafN of YafNO toxin-antitoxin module
MSLQEKVLNLKLNAALAVKHANGWQRLIDLYGEEKATAFYSHLGLNHLEKKSIEWEGLNLSREPKEHEKIAVKGIHGAQESAKGSIGKILLNLREELITDGLKRIQKLKPASYHSLVLQTPNETATTLKEQLITVHHQGRMLVAAELGKKAAIIDDEDEFDDLDMLTDLTTSRVANDVQARIIDAATRHALLGQTGAGLINAVTNEISGGSVTYIDRAARGLANKVINIGRSDEAESRKDEWDQIEYSALLDPSVCDFCAAEDGKTASNEDYLQPAPNPDCLGFDNCRCFHVFIAVGG